MPGVLSSLTLVVSVLFSLNQSSTNGEKDSEEEQKPGFHEVVVVTAARQEQELGDAVSFVSRISAEELASSPALVLDDHLRRVSGFSLFQRSSLGVSPH